MTVVYSSWAMSSAVKKRIIRELKLVCNGKWDEQLVAISVPDPTDILSLSGVILCPTEALNGKYIFTLHISVPHDYPYSPPRVYFKNKVWHPRIVPPIGSICLEELRYWNPSLTINTLLFTIGQVLARPHDIPHDTKLPNQVAANQLWKDERGYWKEALEWADKDNSGYGMVQFQDLRLAAMQSCLSVPMGIPYECHIFYQACDPLKFELIAMIIPCLTVYREKIEKDFCSTLKRVTTSPEFNFNNKEVQIHCGEFSRDRCWEINSSGTVFDKAVVDKLDPRKDSPSKCVITITWLRPELKPNAFTEKFKFIDSSNENEIRSFDIYIDPTKFESQQLSDKQTITLPLLLNLPLSSGKCVNLTEVVGDKYFAFGVHLLHDESGKLVKAIETDHQKQTEPIVTEILMRWIQGVGKSQTWGSLVDVFGLIGYNDTARKIRQMYCNN